MTELDHTTALHSGTLSAPEAEIETGVAEADDPKTKATAKAKAKPEREVTFAEALSRTPPEVRFDIWLLGQTPLIVHAWSEKARKEMVSKQVKANVGSKEARDPEADFRSSLYHLPDGGYGFPATAIKNSWLAMADKSKGLARTGAVGAMASIWIDNAILARQRPGLTNAICDMPLLKLYAPEPEMREDPVKLNGKTASLAYRAQFFPWAIKVTGSFNPNVVSAPQFVGLIQDGGRGIGIGDWRPQRSGAFGTYRLASSEETKLWEEHANGGPFPMVKTVI